MKREDYPAQEPLSEAGEAYSNECWTRSAGIAYDEHGYGPDAYQRLAVYRAAKPNGTILIAWHGGGWTSGYKEWMGFMAPALNAAGITLVSPGYRLAPQHVFPAGLEDCIAAVRAHGAEMGIAFDGDADRIGVVDANGRIIWGDHLLILYARDVLARTGAGQPIIFDVKCSQALTDGIEKAGGTAVMWKTGHSLIKDKMKAMHAPIAGEMSGHMFFTEGFYGHDDALYAAARLLRIVADSGKRIDELLADDERRTMTAAELNAFVVSLNSVRLILGTILDVTDDDEGDDEVVDPDEGPEMAMYNFLSWLLDSAVTALMQG